MVTEVRESDISELFRPETPFRMHTSATAMKAAGRIRSFERASWRHQVIRETCTHLVVTGNKPLEEKEILKQIMFSFCII